jgi:hypothetical protein
MRSRSENVFRWLDGLASDEAVDRRVATQVKALFQSTLAAGLKQNATPEEKVQLCGKVRFNHFELWFARGVS